MERQKKVIDASVIVKWFSEEIDTDKALELKQEHIDGESLLIVPELMFLEVLNCLRYKRKDAAILNKTVKLLWSLQLHVEKINPFLLQKAVELSLKYELSIYDAIYAALAQIHGCQLITEDHELTKTPQSSHL